MEDFDHRSILVDSGSIVHCTKVVGWAKSSQWHLTPESGIYCWGGPLIMGLLLLTRYLPTEYQCHVPMYPIFSFTAKGYSVSSLSFQDQTFHFSKRIPLFHNPTKNKKFATGRSSAQVFNFCALLDRIDLCLIPTWLPHFVPSLQRAGEGALGYKSWCKK